MPHHANRKSLALMLPLLLLAACASAPLTSSKFSAIPGEESAVGSRLLLEMQWNEQRNQLNIRSGCHSFTTLRLDRSRPCLFPLYSPAGQMVLRRHPIEDAVEGEQPDHPHHAGCWIAHGSVGGHDFWHGDETRQSPREWDAFLLDEGEILIVSGKLDWIAGDKRIIEETRTYDFRSEPGLHRTEIWSLWKAPGDESVRIGDTKEGTFALRLASTLRIDGPVAAGSSFNADAQSGGKIWGKRSRWVAYSGPVDGQSVTVVMLDHPDNPRHPTWWHARPYGLFAANPFGQHDFERGPAGSGDLVIGPGEDLFFRHQLLVFDGEVSADRIDQEWTNFANR